MDTKTISVTIMTIITDLVLAVCMCVCSSVYVCVSDINAHKSSSGCHCLIFTNFLKEVSTGKGTYP